MDSPKLLRALLIIFGLVAGVGLLIDVRNTTTGGAIDLRNRVTGVRIAKKDIDPFTYKWSPDEPEDFCDPYNAPGWPMSKTTATPLALALHAPVTGMSYRSVQRLWFWAQYGCLALGFAAWAWNRPKPIRNWGAVFTLALCGSAAWRIHVDRGQIYILYAAVFLVTGWLASRKGALWSFLEGGIGGLLLGLRPTIVGQFASPVIKRRWLALAGIAAGIGLMIALPTLTFGSDIWNQYREGMERHAQLYLEQAKPERLPTAFPASIEGIPIDQLAKFAWIPFADSSVYKLISFDLPSKLMLGAWAAVMLASAIVMLRRRDLPNEFIWWVAAAWFVVADFLLPAFRHNYNDILVWPMLLFGLAALNGRARMTWTAASAALLLAHIAVWWAPKAFIPVPSILGLLLALGVVLLPFLKPQLAPANARDRQPTDH